MHAAIRSYRVMNADRWVVERAAHLVESAPYITAGKVRVRAER